MIGIEHYVLVSSILFVIGVLGIFLNRKNVIVILMALVLLAELIFGILAVTSGGLKLGTPDGTGAPLLGRSNIESIGALLYGKYLFLFETAGIILLVAMIGAIVLTHREKRAYRGQQNISKQIARRPQDATVNKRPEVGQGVEL